MGKYFKNYKARKRYWREHSEKVDKIELWNQLVDDVFKHPKAKYSLFVYELIKRIIFTGDSMERVDKKILKKLKEIK